MFLLGLGIPCFSFLFFGSLRFTRAHILHVGSPLSLPHIYLFVARKDKSGVCLCAFLLSACFAPATPYSKHSFPFLEGPAGWGFQGIRGIPAPRPPYREGLECHRLLPNPPTYSVL